MAKKKLLSQKLFPQLQKRDQAAQAAWKAMCDGTGSYTDLVKAQQALSEIAEAFKNAVREEKAAGVNHAHL